MRTGIIGYLRSVGPHRSRGCCSAVWLRRYLVGCGWVVKVRGLAHPCCGRQFFSTTGEMYVASVPSDVVRDASAGAGIFAVGEEDAVHNGNNPEARVCEELSLQSIGLFAGLAEVEWRAMLVAKSAAGEAVLHMVAFASEHDLRTPAQPVQGAAPCRHERRQLLAALKAAALSASSGAGACEVKADEACARSTVAKADAALVCEEFVNLPVASSIGLGGSLEERAHCVSVEGEGCGRRCL